MSVSIGGDGTQIAHPLVMCRRPHGWGTEGFDPAWPVTHRLLGEGLGALLDENAALLERLLGERVRVASELVDESCDHLRGLARLGATSRIGGCSPKALENHRGEIVGTG